MNTIYTNQFSKVIRSIKTSEWVDEPAGWLSEMRIYRKYIGELNQRLARDRAEDEERQRRRAECNNEVVTVNQCDYCEGRIRKTTRKVCETLMCSYCVNDKPRPREKGVKGYYHSSVGVKTAKLDEAGIPVDAYSSNICNPFGRK